MSIGCFSFSLNVKDIKASRVFYEKLGFKIFHGDESQNWLIMKNGECNIGLFQGMFEKNMMTFNPGWDQNANPVGEFEDVHQLKARLDMAGIEVINEELHGGKGPGSFAVMDPDGNKILIDQHVE